MNAASDAASNNAQTETFRSESEMSLTRAVANNNLDWAHHAIDYVAYILICSSWVAIWWLMA